MGISKATSGACGKNNCLHETFLIFMHGWMGIAVLWLESATW
jgi:hypothetical protein